MTPAWLRLTVPLVIAVALASGGGAFGGAYAHERPSWAAQGVGQDYVNLILVVPALAIAAWSARRGSLGALLVWIGVLLYLAYSYVIYALCVHFNAFFLAYVAALGLSFYAAMIGLCAVQTPAASAAARTIRHQTAIGVFLVLVGGAFAGLWLADVVSATWAGRAPSGAAEAGLPVNPVHVLDLAFALPATMATWALVVRRRDPGPIFAVPALTFIAVIGIAIVGMSWQLTARGITAAGGVPLPIAIVAAVAVALTVYALRDIARATAISAGRA